MLLALGHTVLLQGRNPVKLEKAESALSTLPDGERVESYGSDLSRMAEVAALAKAVAEKHAKLDVLIDNAGVYKAPDRITQDGLDVSKSNAHLGRSADQRSPTRGSGENTIEYPPDN